MNSINPNHTQQRGVLRAVGPLVLFVGLIFMAIGMVSFFSAIGSFDPPKYIWSCFVGMPISFVGLVLTKFAYMGKVARYTAQELAPVGKDTFNYIASGTKEGVADVSEAVFRGKAASFDNSIETRIQKLAKLRDSGIINEEDFEEQKDRILNEV